MNKKEIVITLALLVGCAFATDVDPECEGRPESYFFAVPGSCTQLYHCWRGKINTLTCPYDLWFDNVNKWCTYRSNSGCTEEEIPTTEQPEVLRCEKEGVAMYPFEGDCSKYYICLGVDKDPIEYSCPDKYFFSAEQEQCVPAELSKCSMPDTDVHCPVLSSPTDIAYIPHPTQCSAYYLCSLEGKYQLNCQNNLYWNPQTSSCDYPDQVQCQA